MSQFKKAQCNQYSTVIKKCTLMLKLQHFYGLTEIQTISQTRRYSGMWRCIILYLGTYQPNHTIPKCMTPKCINQICKNLKSNVTNKWCVQTEWGTHKGADGYMKCWWMVSGHCHFFEDTTVTAYGRAEQWQDGCKQGNRIRT